MDQRDKADTVSTMQALSVLEAEINNRLVARQLANEKLIALDNEINGLRQAQCHIEKLSRGGS